MYYFYRYAPFVITVALIGGYGFGSYKIGYATARAHAKQLEIQQFVDIHKACRKSVHLSYIDFKKKVPGTCGESYTMFSYYYDGTVGNCVWNEITR